MSVRRDQVDAQKYVNRRLVSALLTGDANAAGSPLRSIGRATIISVVVGAVIVVGFLGYGFVSRGGSTDWQQEGAVVIARETGTRFVFLDGRLHPVVNLTSAWLIAGGSDVVYVSVNSIAAAPRGEPLGIVGAPDSVPSVTQLVHDAWTACTGQVVLASGASVPSVLVLHASPPVRTDLGPRDAVLVQDADQVQPEPQLIWDGGRWPVDDVDTVLTAFGQRGLAPVAVGTAWANVVPGDRGRIGPPEIPDLGQPADWLSAVARVGQVFVTQRIDGDGDSYYIAYPDGFLQVPISIAQIVLASPEVKREAYGNGRTRAYPIDAAAVAGAIESSATALGPTMPDLVPDLLNKTLDPRARLCATYPLDGGDPVISIVDDLDLGQPDGTSSDPAAYAVADTVFLKAGTGALVQAAVPGDGSTGTVYLITDEGVKYPIAGDDALTALGYANVEPDRVSRLLLDLIPSGPSLDPATARSVVRFAPD